MLYKEICIRADERWTEDGIFDLEWFIHNFDVVTPNTWESYYLLRHGRLPDEPESIENSDNRVILLVLGIFFTLEIGEGQKIEGFRAKRYLQERGVYKRVREYIKETMKNMRADS